MHKIKKLRYICVQPRILYYSWQVEVMINNFILNGINPNDIDVLVATNPNDLTSAKNNIAIWNHMAQEYSDINFYFYEDTRTDFSYIPSVYFNILKQHLKQFPELQSQALFLYDCDSIFTKPIDFSEMIDDDIWYLSDTTGYIGTQYILTKGEEIYNGMCDIIGINAEIPKKYNRDSGGAQHIVKNTTYEYWDKVEKDSIKLYKWFNSIEPDWKRNDYPIQKWTSGMWSLLWNAWLFGHTTKVDKRLDFCWATDDIKKWNECSIYHNAGVTQDRIDLFYKGNYQNYLPYNIDKSIYNQNFCSYKYVEEILKTSKVGCLI